MDKHRTKDSEPQADGDADARDAASNETASAETDDAGRNAGEAPVGEAPSASGAGDGTDAATQSVRELQDKYLRLAAEFENYRKRNARERQEAGWRAQAELVMGLIDSLDDILRFAHVDPASVESSTVVEGVAIVEKKMLKALAGHGLEVINPLDQLFDPAFHEAVGTEPALSREDDHLIARVYQPGYVFRGQLLRPARVVVRQWLG